MSKVKYSIVIPTKNRANLCQRLINSIDNAIVHSKIKRSSFELIVVEDSGIKHSFSSRVLNPNVLVNTKKHNAAYSRNRGGLVARGHYIVFFDDDIIIPENYFVVLDNITKTVKFDILGTRAYSMSKKARDIFFSLIFVYARKLGYFVSANLIITKEFFKKVGFDEDSKIAPAEDYKFFFDIQKFRPKIYYSKKLYFRHEKISIYHLLKKLMGYSTGFRRVHKKIPKSFGDLNKNSIYELNDDISLSIKYKTLPILIKMRILCYFVLLNIIFLVVNPGILIPRKEHIGFHVRNLLSYVHFSNRPKDNIIGWLTAKECNKLMSLSKSVRLYGDILEIGHFCGKSTYYLAKGLKNSEKLYTIDDHSIDRYSNIFSFGIRIPNNTKEVFNNNLLKFGIQNKVVSIFKRSEEAYNELMSRKFRLIFIDGSHDYVDAKKDVDLYSKTLIDGGIMALHDAYGLMGWEGAKRVYRELRKNSNMEFIGITDTMAYFKKRN